MYRIDVATPEFYTHSPDDFALSDFLYGTHLTVNDVNILTSYNGYYMNL